MRSQAIEKLARKLRDEVEDGSPTVDTINKLTIVLDRSETKAASVIREVMNSPC